MTKKIILFSIATCIASLYLTTDEVHTNSSSGPISGGKGYTGSAFDGRTCGSGGGCHTSSNPVSSQSGWVTSNVPSTGYIPGSTYTITVTGTLSSSTRIGFQATATDHNGIAWGTLIAGTGTQIQNSGKHITHTFSSTSTNTGSASWSFDWKAPAIGTGNVTINAVVNATNNNGGTGGDQVFTSSLTLSEDVSTVGLSQLSSTANKFTIFPNPTHNKQTTVYLNNTDNASFSVRVYDLQGKIVSEPVSNKSVFTGHTELIDFSSMISGVYFIALEQNSAISFSKLIVQ